MFLYHNNNEYSVLNVDLDIESVEDLQIIIAEFGKNVSVSYHDKNEIDNNFAVLSVLHIDSEINEILSSFCALIENLSPTARCVWDNCLTRKFDAGFESGNSRNDFKSEINAETIKRVAKLGASIAVTIYPTTND